MTTDARAQLLGSRSLGRPADARRAKVEAPLTNVRASSQRQGPASAHGRGGADLIQ